MLINCFSRLNTGGRTIASDLSVAAFFRDVLGRTVCVRLLTDKRFLLLCNLVKGTLFYFQWNLEQIESKKKHKNRVEFDNFAKVGDITVILHSPPVFFDNIKSIVMKFCGEV